MAIYIGTSPVSAVYQGTTQLSQAYVGSAPALANNLIGSLAWVAGANTAMTTTSGLTRATASPSATPNPRVVKGPFNIVINKTYQFSGKVYERTAGTNLYLRVSLSSSISSADFYQNTVGGVGGTLDLTGQTFVAGQTGQAYLGIIPAVNFAGEYGEIDDNFSIVQTN